MKGDTVGKTYTGNVLMLKLILIDFQHNKWLPLSCGQARTESFRFYLAQGHSQPVFRHNKPAQQAFPCSFGARNEERESKTARKNGASKRAGRGFVGGFLSSPPPSFIFALSLHFSRGQDRKSRSSVCLCSAETRRKRFLRGLRHI